LLDTFAALQIDYGAGVFLAAYLAEHIRGSGHHVEQNFSGFGSGLLNSVVMFTVSMLDN